MASWGKAPRFFRFTNLPARHSWCSRVTTYTRVAKDHNIWRSESNRNALFTSPRPFISSTRIDFNPQFSPDGTRIAFESTRSGSMEDLGCQ